MDPFVMNLIFYLVMFALVVLTFVGRGMLLRRAAFQVIAILRERHSRCSEIPKTLDDLGLRPPNLMTRLTRTKDYKPYALQALIRVGAVRMMKDERVCLIEEKLRKEL